MHPLIKPPVRSPTGASVRCFYSYLGMLGVCVSFVLMTVVQFQLPGYSLVLYWVQRQAFDLSQTGPPAHRLAAKFFNSEAQSEAARTWRKDHLKMVPHITEGG